LVNLLKIKYSIHSTYAYVPTIAVNAIKIMLHSAGRVIVKLAIPCKSVNVIEANPLATR
jgi:hypothetical protein